MAELSTGTHEVDVEHLTLKGPDGAPIDAIHARPDGMPHSGLAVCSPEPFARAPVEVRGDSDSAARMGHVKELDDELQLGDLEAAADYLVVHDDVREVAVLGFCMGGMQVLKAAGTGRFDRAVAFYGMIRPPEDWVGPKTRLPLDTIADVCPTLAIFGGNDPFTPASDIEALRAAWADRPDCEIVVYDDAEHGFVHAPERDAHRAADAADAWGRVLAFLQPT